MKVKLLKKVRANYRVVVNGLGEEMVQKKHLWWWEDLHFYSLYDIELAEHWMGRVMTGKEKLIYTISSTYKDYHKKTKELEAKKNNWKVKI